MPGYKVINRGVPGATAADLLASLPDLKQKMPYTDVILIMVGTNDVLSGNFEYINTLKKIFVQLSHDFPSAEILVNSLFPMKLAFMSDYTIVNLNNHVEAFSMQTGCCFLDVYQRFVDSNQVLFQEDGVHLTKAAYELWTRTLLEHIAFLIEND